MPPKLVLYLYEAWADLDQAIAGLTAKDATTQLEGGSCVAWSVAHVTQQVDSWLVSRLQGLPRHPHVGDPRFGIGGDGSATDWDAVTRGVAEVRESARRFLDHARDADLQRVMPYTGSLRRLRDTGLPVDYAILRIAAHHFTHVGEIETIRTRLGNPTKGLREWGLPLLG